MDQKIPNSKELFESLFSDLYENKVVYHERVTMLCEVIRYEVTEDGFDIWLNWVKPLYLSILHPRYLDTREQIHLASAFRVGEDSFRLYDGHSIGRQYCPFTLWTDPETVESVCRMSEEELETDLHTLLWK